MPSHLTDSSACIRAWTRLARRPSFSGRNTPSSLAAIARFRLDLVRCVSGAAVLAAADVEYRSFSSWDFPVPLSPTMTLSRGEKLTSTELKAAKPSARRRFGRGLVPQTPSFRSETAANPRPNREKRRRQLTRGQARGGCDDLFLQPFCRSGERSFAVGGHNEFV